ncbi:phenylalanine--tRNA ligase subunit beta [Methyloligella sp. 2.7D]|uniref:phenylalanine--tRNA ligase subunit beta n=1 Tax=unclassified Methyloligella TaxID=2625955 RepID=UPI00157C69D7|nr:phenylalanine--tRNA ligase subunit beta [Methyloligella sp. GL2]QKP76092.1 phenylalanine--tRNA ligase subunit beta [Methyloligella sp. GL2]
MKFTLSWLKQHLETDASLAEIADTLTEIGLEVEEIVDPAEALSAFTVAYVAKCEKHPDADKLQVCTVETGNGTFQVVCGAANAHAGMKGVFAPVGTYVPGIDLTLTKAKIRGVESFGMLCSERELELSDEHHGIIELSEDAEVGSPAAAALGLTDAVIDIAITPNRPDCLAVSGIARDLAAAGLGTFKDQPVAPVQGSFANPQPIALEFSAETASACPVFAGRVVKGVKNGPSPDWLQAKLKAIGLRPINALVDITNYISYDRARPLHVYDADKLSGTIKARLGETGERFEALDGKTYEVDAEACVIADDARVLGLGGIMGGEETGCTEETVNVFIESAYFDPIRTAKTGRRLNIISDARFRFERGVDPAFVVPGLELATEMVLELCGGEASEIEIAGEAPEGNSSFSFDISEVKRLSGLELAPEKIEQLLTALGFGLRGSAPVFEVSVPSWRPDVFGPADIVEEVVRLVGVANVPATPMPRVSGVAKPVLTEMQKRQRRARRLLAGRGLVEAVTWSFIPKKEAEAFGGGQASLVLDNPISSELSDMRPSLLPGLITAAQRNADRGLDDGALFELGQIYGGDQPEDQRIAASGVRFGNIGLEGSGRDWAGNAKPADVFAAKADLAALLDALGLDASNLMIVAEAPDWFHPGRSGSFKLGPKVTLGVFGEIHPLTLEALGADGPMAAFELDLGALPQPKRKGRSRSALGASDLQAVRRDFAFLVDADVPAGDLLRAARGADKALISNVGLFDVFTGKGVPEGKKSLAIEVTLQPIEKTLTDKEIDAVAEKIVAAVVKATGGELRG